jgi:uncharacterized protein
MTPPDRAVGRPLTDAELDRLEHLLDSPALGDTAMRTDVLHGFLAAVASAPVPIPRERWLEEALGQGDAAALPEQREARALIERMYADVARLLLEGHGVEPLLYPEADEADAADEALDYAPWCEGYLAGMALAEPPWSEFAAGDELAALIAPFLALALEGAPREASVPGPLDDLTPEELAEYPCSARERLPEAVQDVYDWLDARRPKAEPLKREAPKVGRNEPCPCGSGRKHKRCCGAT